MISHKIQAGEEREKQKGGLFEFENIQKSQ